MKPKSPSVKKCDSERMFMYNSKKKEEQSSSYKKNCLSIVHLPSIDIIPKLLSIHPTIINLPAKPLMKPQALHTLTPYPSHCKVCQKVIEDVDDYKWHYETQHGRDDCSILKSMLGYRPISNMSAKLTIQAQVHPKPHVTRYPHQCQVCQKLLKDQDDYKWHYETQYGREDCSILKSMLKS